MMTLAFAKILGTKVITHQLLFLLLGENVQVQHNNQFSKQKQKIKKTINNIKGISLAFRPIQN